jgi:hypothetical protein
MASTDQDVHESDSGLNNLISTQSASTSITTRPKRVRHKFISWTFQLKFNADAAALNGGLASVTLQERQKYVLQHIRSRIKNTDIMPRIVTFVEAYFSTSIISGALPESRWYFDFHSVALSRQEPAQTVKFQPCNSGSLLSELQSRAACQATRNSKMIPLVCIANQ